MGKRGEAVPGIRIRHHSLALINIIIMIFVIVRIVTCYLPIFAFTVLFSTYLCVWFLVLWVAVGDYSPFSLELISHRFWDKERDLEAAEQGKHSVLAVHMYWKLRPNETQTIRKCIS